MNKWKRATCGLLAVLMATSSMAGCGGKKEEVVDKKVVSLPAEQQILTDSYQQNPAINEYMTYTTDVASYTDYSKTKPETYTSLWKLFDVHTIQIDCMDLIYLGESTMGDIVQRVDDANKAAVKYATESVRAARQKIIDDAYAAEKAKYEAKGKPYNKQKAVADISDLNYVNPYRYRLAYDNTDKETKDQYPYIWIDYDAPRLVDPDTTPTLYLFILKYDVPYVQCTFQRVEGDMTYRPNARNGEQKIQVKMYNNLIDQEKDWVLTRIAAADCTFLVDQQTLYVPPYVDEDWNSKGSKNNMVTNGNVRFGGAGFDWDSLMTLCKALGLVMYDVKVTYNWRGTTAQVSNAKASSYLQHSDSYFTYYTIYLPINKFYKQTNGDYAIPIATLTVTFNKKTNACINWDIDYGKWYHVFPASTVHMPGEVYEVNVRSHQLDTTDYYGMLKTVDDWINANKVQADFGYYLVNKDGVVIGKIDNGLSNYQIELSVNGQKYYCTQPPSDLSSMQGYYITQAEKDALAAEGKEDSDTAIADVSKLYYIMCMAVGTTEKGQSIPLGYFNNTGVLVNDKKEPAGYYIHDIDYDPQTGYKNAVIIGQEVYDLLLQMYIRTFKFSLEMEYNMETLYNEGDPWRMYQYITKYVEANEANKKQIKDEVSSAITEQTSKPTKFIKEDQGVLDFVDNSQT